MFVFLKQYAFVATACGWTLVLVVKQCGVAEISIHWQVLCGAVATLVSMYVHTSEPLSHGHVACSVKRLGRGSWYMSEAVSGEKSRNVPGLSLIHI